MEGEFAMHRTQTDRVLRMRTEISMLSWFNKKKSPDGTNIVRHENIETKLDVTEGTAGFREQREAAYERLFGKPLSVSHELLPLVPHIDVYTFKRSQSDREVFSLGQVLFPAPNRRERPGSAIKLEPGWVNPFISCG